MGGATLPGLLLLNEDAKRVDPWVRHGVVPSYVVQLSGWAGVVPAGPSQAQPPYDKPLTVLASKPVPMPMRPALGFFQIQGRAVVIVHPRRWRALPRWVVWEPGLGVTRVNLPQAHPGDLARAAGVVDEQQRAVAGILADREARIEDVLFDLIDALALPGSGLLRGKGVKDNEDAMLIEPHRRSAARFDKVARGGDDA